MRILGINNVGNKSVSSTSQNGAVPYAYAPIVKGSGQLRTDSFERTTTPDGQVVITEKKTVVRNKKAEATAQTYPSTTKAEQSVPQVQPMPKPINQAQVEDTKTQQVTQVDTNKKVVKPSDVPPKGTTNPDILAQAPNPQTTIQGQERTATIVIDLSTNILYKYDDDGNPEIAYRVASGKKSTPTNEGVRVVTHTETYPYKTAPKATKRYKNPADYGPKLIHLLMVNPNNGKKWDNGEYIHGNNNASSIGKYASKGCVRMDNEVIKILSSQVQKGDVVIIKKY